MASFGENLRRERELRGVSLREISEATKISKRFLEALEQDRLDVLPGGLFPKSFVRQYARHLGLDAERLVGEFLFLHGAGVQTEPPRPPAADRLPLGALMLVGLAALLVAMWFARPRLAEPKAPARETAAAPAAPAVPVAQPAERVYPPPSQRAQPAEAQPLVLTLSARQNCWVAVTIDGETILNRVLAEGESQTLEANSEIVLSVGNAGGIRFTVNDQQGVPLGRSGEVRRNIVITRQSLPSLVADAPAEGSGSS
jgi:cytoskeleton protein RodZ